MASSYSFEESISLFSSVIDSVTISALLEDWSIFSVFSLFSFTIVGLSSTIFWELFSSVLPSLTFTEDFELLSLAASSLADSFLADSRDWISFLFEVVRSLFL